LTHNCRQQNLAELADGRIYRRAWLLMLWLVACVCACTTEPNGLSSGRPTLAPTLAESGARATTQPAATITLSPSPVPPTPTPEPPAVARVNGEPITQEAFLRELLRYEAAQQALDRDAAGAEHQVLVLDTLIEMVMIRQAAAANGVTVSEQQVDAEIDRLKQYGGDTQSFQQWLETNLYQEPEFRETLHTQMLVQAMAERIAATVPETMTQVHARHIVVADETTANQVLAQLQQGTDFATLARETSLDESTRLGGGDLGYFPQGFLLSPEVEEAAFGLQIGETSGVIRSAFGYHIVQVTGRDPARPVATEVLQRLREQAFQRWLFSLWDTAVVERYTQ